MPIADDPDTGDDLAESITVLERNGYWWRSRDRQRREKEAQETTLPSGSSKAGNGDRLPREVLAKTIPRTISEAESRDAKREITPIGTRTSSDKNANNGLLFSLSVSLSLLPDRRRFISLESRASMLTAAEILQHSILRCQSTIFATTRNSGQR